MGAAAGGAIPGAIGGWPKGDAIGGALGVARPDLDGFAKSSGRSFQLDMFLACDGGAIAGDCVYCLGGGAIEFACGTPKGVLVGRACICCGGA